MHNAASTASRINGRAHASEESAPAFAGLSLRWNFARGDRSGLDELVLHLSPESAVLERRRDDAAATSLRSASSSSAKPLVVEIASSSCGRYTSVHVADVVDAVMDEHDRCVYARSEWIAELHPLGGQCEFMDGAIVWSR